MNSTREKLAACLGEHFHQSAYAGRTLDALEAIVMEERNAVIEAAAARWEADAKALPVQHEHPGRGQSTYNWQMHFARELRALKVSK